MVWRAGERDPEREGGGAQRKRWRQIAMGERGGGSDVDAGGEVEKVNPRLECERNEGNGGVFLWLGRDKERKREEVEDWEGGRFKT